ncbi:MAG: ATP synthase F1 subunit epsilon [Bacillota bacterium]|nr:ATP synthase F1 subunit epsilon [Bacillota bacterium]
MAKSFFLEIITPYKKIFADDAEMIIFKTPEGEMAVLSGHMPLVAAVSIGQIRIKKNDEWLEAFVSEGFIKIGGDKTTLIVDTAEWPDEIDVNRANAAAERAREKLQMQLSNKEFATYQAALQRAMVRLKIKRRS